MDWDLVQVFLAAYDSGSATAAAKTLGINQSTASRRLAALEEELGSKLFDRTPEGLLPTELGARLRPQAESMAAAADALARLADGYDQSVSGRVRLATAEGMAVHLLLPQLHELRAKHPNLKIDILTGLSLVDLGRREADIALRFVKPTQPDLIAKRIASPTHGIFASRDYLAGRQARGPEDLEWIGISERLSHYPDAQWIAANAPEPILRVDSYIALFRAVQCGLGATILDRPLGQSDPDLTELTWDLPPTPVLDLWLVTHRALRRVARIDAVWRWVLETCRPLSRSLLL